jgi:hypothetical protein
VSPILVQFDAMKWWLLLAGLVMAMAVGVARNLLGDPRE